ncbi:MAG: two-component system sensor histidine kinase NtrB [Sulfurihydrogenibium sp.]
MYEKEILDNIQEPLILVDKNANIIYSNQAFDTYSYYVDVKTLISDMLSLKPLKEGISIKNYVYNTDNYTFLIDVYPTENGLYIFFIKDVTRLFKLEEELKKEGMLSTVSKFLIEILHDIKGPITGIKAAAEFLKQYPEETEVLEDILYEVKRMEEFLKQLSSLSKPIQLNLSYENIHKLLDKVIKNYQNIYKNVDFIRIYDPSLPDVQVDSEKMSFVFENLIKNAIEAINQKGSITIETGISKDPVFSPNMNKVSIKIRDSGKGVPEELLDKIFLPFFTTKSFGSGIGLSSAYSIVKSHKGILRYIGNSTFEIILPIGKEIERD